MKRREAKFVHASPRLAPDQIKASPRLREDRARVTGKGARGKTAARAPQESEEKRARPNIGETERQTR